MPYAFRYALRNVFARRGGLRRMTTVSALAGIAFGVACLILVQSVYEGFRNGVETKLLAQTAHIAVAPKVSGGPSPEMVKRVIKEDANVESVSAELTINSVAARNGKTAFGLIRIGFSEEKSKADKNVYFGKELARLLDAGRGDAAEIVFEDADGKPASVELLVGGLSESGLYEYDARLIRMDSGVFRELTGTKPEPNTYNVRLKDPFDSDSTAAKLKNRLGPQFGVSEWRSVNRPLFEALSFERRISFLVFGVIVFLASLGVASMLSLFVTERRIDIAVLKTCGVRPLSVASIFFLEGFLLCSLGIVVGVVFGYLGCLAANQSGFTDLSGEVYAITSLTISPRLFSVASISAGALLLITPALLVPVIKAARIKPADLLRTL